MRNKPTMNLLALTYAHAKPDLTRSAIDRRVPARDTQTNNKMTQDHKDTPA